MTILRENKDSKVLVQDKLKAVFSELLDCDHEYALEFANWISDKIVSNKKHLIETQLNKEIKYLKTRTDEQSQLKLSEAKIKRVKILPKNYPSSLVKGDIIHVKYGVSLGDELNENHYGIIINRRGSLYLVAPLTSTPQPEGELNIHLKNLGLPGEGKDGSYVSFNHIRFIHYRRIQNVKKIKNGRVHIDPSIADKVVENFFKLNHNK
jgi:hypothetical protein